MTNRLASESSPYLRQHAGNPVAWWPWGAEALAEARASDRPILLSIGYAACHWCHVMAHESFENAETAAIMNANFVNVKVDREERPDLDGIYMQAVQAMTGQGGWPMTVFLTPEGVPFFGGTYFPPSDRHGLPGFPRVLRSVADAWRTRRSDLLTSAGQVRAIYADSPLAGAAGGGSGATTLDAERLHNAFDAIVRTREPRFEGLGGAPKFPHAMALDFCLRQWARRGDARGLDIAHKTFLAMARGGICDQVGGGFHRYSTDARWLVPHFEKMLYDNALLARLGVHLWQATGDVEVRRVTEAALEWACAELTVRGGGFCSSLDADSEGVEGRFYVWSERELRAVLGADFDTCAPVWGVTAGGNFEGANILHVADPASAARIEETLVRARRALYATRAKRVWPGRDDKVIASWNALMVRALADAGRAFGDPRWLDAAVGALVFTERELVRDGRVMRSWLGGAAKVGGFLEDYAAFGLACVGVYQATFDRRWLDRARELAGACVTWFWSGDIGAFYDTAHDQEQLITRPRDMADNATPAGTSLAAELLLMVAEYFDDPEARQRAEAVLGASIDALEGMPVMFGHLLGAADMAVYGAIEVAIAGDVDDARTRALRDVVAARYVPSLVIAAGSGDAVRGMPLFDGRAPDVATAYVCRGYSCSLPVSDAATLRTQLDALGGAGFETARLPGQSP